MKFTSRAPQSTRAIAQTTPGPLARPEDPRATLTPQMRAYDACFGAHGSSGWTPYLVYFHPANYSSSVVNTDSLGFRVANCDDEFVTVGDHAAYEVVNLLAGSSTVFGIGASSDAWTMASRMNLCRMPGAPPWLNMGGRSHNSAQEMILHALFRHRLPKVERIVLFSGVNDLGLARRTAETGLQSGAFFLYKTFFERLERSPRQRRFSRVLGRGLRSVPTTGEREIGVEEQLETGAALTLRHLDTWRALAADAGAELTYVLQPLAGWVRKRCCAQEAALFNQLDELGGFSETYRDICDAGVGLRYAGMLSEGCERIGVAFAAMAPLLGESLTADDWMFVDRTHFTDFGYDLAARLLTDKVMR
jgi:hypothetical protein